MALLINLAEQYLSEQNIEFERLSSREGLMAEMRRGTESFNVFVECDSDDNVFGIYIYSLVRVSEDKRNYTPPNDHPALRAPLQRRGIPLPKIPLRWTGGRRSLTGWWCSVKYEEVYLKDYARVPELLLGLTTYFEFYNGERPHQAFWHRGTLRSLCRRWPEKAISIIPVTIRPPSLNSSNCVMVSSHSRRGTPGLMV